MQTRITKSVLMIAYTEYTSDARVRREAESIAALIDFKVSVLVLKEKSRRRSYMLDGVEVIELDISKYRGKSKPKYLFSYLKYFLCVFLEITKRALRGDADAVHVHNMPNLLIMAAFIPKLNGCPVFLDIHDSMPETYLAKFGGKSNRLVIRLLVWEERMSAKLADRVFCVNHLQMKTLVARGIDSDKITVLLNVPDPNKFMITHNRKVPARKAGEFKIVYHGTISKRLGIDLAIKAMAILKSQIDGLKFHVIGSGDDLEACIQLSKDLGLDDCVHFSGKLLSLEKLKFELEKMDIGLVPNRRNVATNLMLPVKMLEYFALGIPVAAPNLPAIKYYFDSKVLSYYQADSTDSMAGAIHAMYVNPSKRECQAKSAQQFLDQYGWDKHKLKLIRVYQTL